MGNCALSRSSDISSLTQVQAQPTHPRTARSLQQTLLGCTATQSWLQVLPQLLCHGALSHNLHSTVHAHRTPALLRSHKLSKPLFTTCSDGGTTCNTVQRGSPTHPLANQGAHQDKGHIHAVAPHKHLFREWRGVWPLCGVTASRSANLIAQCPEAAAW